MVDCRRCSGEGFESYDDDERRVYNACYHCSGSGSVDEEADFRDRLWNVVSSLAYQNISKYRDARNSGEDGFEEDFQFMAAENMMLEYDYFRILVWDEEYVIYDKLSKMSLEDQELLVAWNEMESELVPFDKPKLINLAEPIAKLGGNLARWEAAKEEKRQIKEKRIRIEFLEAEKELQEVEEELEEELKMRTVAS